MIPLKKQHPAGRPGAGHTKAGEVCDGFRHPIIHEPNFRPLFYAPSQPTTPLQIWDCLELALESSRNPNRWTFRDQIKRCRQVSAASVEVDNGFSRWFWYNVPRLFHHAYVTVDQAPGSAACLLEACGNYSDRARPIFKQHRKSGFVYTEADHRVLIRATLLVLEWMVGELSEKEHDEFNALGPVLSGWPR